MIRLIFLFLLIVFLALMQRFGFSILDVRPDIALIGLIASSFWLEDIWEGVSLASLGALILKSNSTLDSGALTFFLIAIIAVIIAKRSPWHSFISAILMFILGTIIFYGVLARELLFSFVFAKELILNVAIGIAIFALLDGLWENESIDISFRG